MYPRNAASPERIAIGAVVQISDGAVQTAGVSVKVMPQGAVAAAGLGTIAYEEGVVHYLPTQAETNYTSFMVIAYKAACIPVAQTIVTTASATAGTALLAPVTHTSAVIPTVSTLTGHTAQTGDTFARLGAPAGASVSADVAAVKADTAAVKVKTDFLPSATAGAAGGVFIAGTNAATSITTALTANITGNLSGSVGSVTGAVGSVTGNVGGSVVGSVASVTGAVGSVTGNVGGNVTGSVGSVAAGGIARASLAADTGLQSIRSNTAQAGAATSITLDAGASAVTDYYKNTLVILTGGTGVGQGRYITAYNGTTKVATVTAWATAPDPTSTFAVLSSDAFLTAAQVNAECDAALLDVGLTTTVTGRIDAAVSSRLAAAGYTAPDNATITAIKAKTDNLPAAPAAVGDIPTAIQNADALLNRDMSLVSDTIARSPLNALRFLRNKWSLSGTTLTVTKENDTTAAWTATVTAAPGADPISGSDPT